MIHREQHEEAFVIQFRKATGGGRQAFAGRVEHVSSGKVGHFDSPEQLAALLSSMLATSRASHNETSSETEGGEAQ